MSESTQSKKALSALDITLYTISAILLPYIGMHLACLKLRRRDAPQPGCFRIPGTWLHRLLSVVCILILSTAITLFFWVPGEPRDWVFLRQVGTGVLVTLLLGEYLVHIGEQAQKELERPVAKLPANEVACGAVRVMWCASLRSTENRSCDYSTSPFNGGQRRPTCLPAF